MSDGAPPDLERDRVRAAVRAKLFGGQDAPVSVGRYQIRGLVGRGAMGVVYVAYDPQLDREVALKLVRPGAGSRDDVARARLLREAQAMARLAHPHVVTVHDAGTHEGDVFVAMERIRGVTLRAWLGGKPPWHEVVRMFCGAGEGLAAAHAQSLVHRDFKPENVLVGEDGRARVLDFGLARSLDLVDDPSPTLQERLPLAVRLTRSGAMVGTPAYMAPEQLRGDPITERADQYSFCVALYEALYGELPHAGEGSVESHILAVISGARRPVPQTAVPAALHGVLSRGMSIQPAERHASMRALLDELARIASTPRVQSTPHALAAPLAKAALALGIAMLTVAAVVGVWWLSRPSPPPSPIIPIAPISSPGPVHVPAPAPPGPSVEDASVVPPDAGLLPDASVRPDAGARSSASGRAEAEIRRVVNSESARFALGFCERARASSPNPRGRLTVRFRVTATGSTTSAAIASDSVGDPGLAACVLREAARWRFSSSVDVSRTHQASFAFPTGG